MAAHRLASILLGMGQPEGGGPGPHRMVLEQILNDRQPDALHQLGLRHLAAIPASTKTIGGGWPQNQYSP